MLDNNKKQILAVAFTEYHVLVIINEYKRLYENSEEYELTLVLKQSNTSRTAKLNFDFLPFKVEYWDFSVDKKGILNKNIFNKINYFIENPPFTFILFQEMNISLRILSNELFKNGTSINLYPDGNKPYLILKFHSLGVVKHTLLQNIQIRKNGFKVGLLDKIWDSKHYAFINGITKIFLTHPNVYENWNNKIVETFYFLEFNILNNLLEKVWNFIDLKEFQDENIIFFVNQYLNYEDNYEVLFIKKLHKKFPDKLIYVKIHPLTDSSIVDEYRNLSYVKLIENNIPAEIYLQTLSNSVALSVNSSALLLNNTKIKYYYLEKLFKSKSKRLGRWKTPTYNHIKYIESIEEIYF